MFLKFRLMIPAKKERILLKISGGNLKEAGNNSFFNEKLIKNLIEQIIKLSEKYSVALVIGGGNIWRGKENELTALKNQNTHYIGMMATLINSVVIQNFLGKENIKSTIYSALTCPQISESLNPQKINDSLNNSEITIFAAGTGMPYVSTDTCAAIRAIEIGAKKVLFGKDNIKGVYDKDPKKHKDAVFFKKLTYDEIICKNLDVLDQTSLLLSKKHNLKLCLFNQNEKNSFLKALNNEIECTEIS